MCDQQSLRSACAYAQSDQSLCLMLEYSMSVKLLTEHHLEFLSLKGGSTGSSEATLVKMPHCWKSHVAAQLSISVNDSVNEEMDGKPLETKPAQPKFVMSKWETIDENELEAQGNNTQLTPNL